MKFLKYIYTTLILLATLFTLGSCSSSDDNLSKAVLPSARTLSFEGTKAVGQIITVYADADWVAEVPEWITVNPVSGSGQTDVTISVVDNIRDGALDNPRKAVVAFKGATLASRSEVLVMQGGDKFRDVKEYTVGDLAALKDEAIVSVPNITVMAVTTTGFIATDEAKTSTIYVKYSETVNVGDKVSIMGDKFTDAQALPFVSADILEVMSTGGTVTYPASKDITKEVDTYNADTRVYIEVSGVLNGNNILVEGATSPVNIVDAPEAFKLDKLKGHRVTVKGYFAGVAKPVLRIMITEIEDNGVDRIIYFSDDFEWMLPWAVASDAGDTVEKSGDDRARNVYTHAALKDQFVPALNNLGYELICSPATTTSTYLQKSYLKFGRTNVQAGIVLPPIGDIPANTKVKISFDWAPMVGSSGKFDPVEVIVLITNGAETVKVGPMGHSFVDVIDKLSWLRAEFVMEDVIIDENTKITIRSKSWDDAKVNDTDPDVYQRWFLDNIEITKAD